VSLLESAGSRSSVQRVDGSADEPPASVHAHRSYARASWAQRRPDAMWLLVLVPAILFLVAFFLYPLMKVLLQSVFIPRFSLANYQKILGESTYLYLIWNTIRISFEVAIGTLLVGYPIAVWLSRLRGVALSFGLILVMMPLWTSALVRNYAWIIVLRRGGPVSNFIEGLGFDTPNLLYSETTVILGMIYTLLPYMVFTLYNSMRNIDGRLVAAARGLGASPLQAFVRIYLPLSMPAVSAGFLLVFIIAIGFFVTPAMLGGGHVEMIAPQIDTQMNMLTNWGFGAALSTILFLIVAAVMMLSIGVFDVEALGFQKGAATAVADDIAATAGRIDTTAVRRLGPMMGPRPLVAAAFARAPLPAGPMALTLFSVLILSVLFLPIVVIAGSSFTASPYIAFPPQGWSLKWYEAVLRDRGWIEAAVLSVKAAALSAAFAVVLGMIAALCLVRGRFAGRQAIYLLIMAPMIVPTIVMAVGVYFLFIELKLLGTIWSFVLAYTVQSLPIVVLVVTSALRRVNVSLERLATLLGASPIRAFFSVTIPAIWPAIAAAGLFAFIHAFDDVVIAEFIAGTTTATLPKKMWVSLVYSIDPTISVVSTLFIAVSILMLMGVTAVQAIGKSRTGQESGQD
jgi:putative spermidine/putrescine transport system permease protein